MLLHNKLGASVNSQDHCGRSRTRAIKMNESCCPRVSEMIYPFEETITQRGMVTFPDLLMGIAWE